MKKILIIGSAPLPEGKGVKSAAGLRTWQFYKGLEEHDVRMVTICDKQELAGEDCFFKDDRRIKAKLQAIVNSFAPDLVVSINTMPSFLVSQLDLKMPFWADLNGWVMAEGQAQAYKAASNDFLGRCYQYEKSILEHADYISTVSTNQKYAVYGELAFLGRLNKETFGKEMVVAIRNARERKKEGEKERRGEYFNLLWLGGYNTWVDEVTLFKGVEMAMKEDEKIVYTSTGGALEGLDGETFQNFKKLVERSIYKERFKFLGWVENEQIPAIYKEADVGLNVDRMCAETLFGARNRINEMMAFGLPVISTRGSEIADEMAKVGAGLVVESGNAAALAEAILRMSRSNEEELREFGANGERYTADLTYKKSLTPLLEVLERPLEKMPKTQVNLGKMSKLRAGWFYLRKNGLRKFFRKLVGSAKGN